MHVPVFDIAQHHNAAAGLHAAQAAVHRGSTNAVNGHVYFATSRQQLVEARQVAGNNNVVGPKFLHKISFVGTGRDGGHPAHAVVTCHDRMQA